MNGVQSKTRTNAKIPSSYWVGQELNWQSPTSPVELRVELPYWLMVPDGVQVVEVNGHKFAINICAHHQEVYANSVLDSRRSCIYIGPAKSLSADLQKAIRESKATILPRKCKTVLQIQSDCNKDVLAASNEQGGRRRSAHLYLKSFCEAHFEVINRLIQQYRLPTYDYFAYELSPWDAPIWFVCSSGSYVRIALQDYGNGTINPQLRIAPVVERNTS